MLNESQSIDSERVASNLTFSWKIENLCIGGILFLCACVRICIVCVCVDIESRELQKTRVQPSA